MEKITRSLEALYNGDIRELEAYLNDHGCYDLTYVTNIDGTYWLLCHPTEDLRLMLKLKFNVAEIVDKYGTDINFNH